MAKQGNQSVESYLEMRIAQIYGSEIASYATQHLKNKWALIVEDPESPLQNTLNKLIYPFLGVNEALGIKGIPAEEASQLLLKLWEEMPEEIKISKLNTMCDDDRA